MSPQSTQAIFSLIAAGDGAGIEDLLDLDPMLIHARHESPDMHHWTTLQYAASIGNLDACRLLVDRGAEVYTNPMNTYPPVIQAAWNHHPSVVDYFLDDIPERADGTNGLGVAINLAAREGWVDLVRRHIEMDPLSVHQRGWIGDSPLHWPSHNNQVEIVRMLLDAGADIEADETNCYGGKPLHWASEHAPAAVELLLSRGAEVNSRNMRANSSLFGMTPLIMNATQRDDCAAVTELLINAGADVSAVDATGRSALDHARERNLVRIIAVLERHGAPAQA